MTAGKTRASREGLTAERAAAVTDAGALLAQGKHADAKKGMAEVNADAEATPSKVAKAGATVAHQRQVAVLRAELKAAEKEKDVVKASAAVSRLLEVAPGDASAKAASRKYGRAVIDRYLEGPA